MLRPEITFDDIVLIIFVISISLTYYMGYRAGKEDGYKEGCRVRRRTARQIRRTR